jgi:hypothetical protein
LEHYPRGKNFLKKSFHQFNTIDTVKWFNDRNVYLKTEEDGRVFPVTNQSQTIIDCLVNELNQYNVKLTLNTEVKSIKSGIHSFIVETSRNTHEANFVVVCGGGYPKSSGFDWLKNTGHSFQHPIPSLFTFNLPKHPICGLMGVSVKRATVQITGTKLKQQGPILITHWGLSGPAVLKLSAWAARELSGLAYQFNILVNWLPDESTETLRQKWPDIQKRIPTQKISGKNPFNLPQRLWIFLLHQSGIKLDESWHQLASKQKNALLQNLTQCYFQVNGKTTFKEEFVTCGGISLTEIDSTSMESKLVPGLYFAGEILDIDGVTGGFNFQHAWTSAFVAANHIARKNQTLQS